MMVPVPGGEVWAEDTGGDGPPLLLLHPGIGDSRIWDPLMPTLTETYRVIRYDSRGYGRSPAATSEFTLLDDCVSVLDHLGVARTPVVGCSQGGGIGLGLALAQPDRVEALVLLCPGISGYAWPEEPEVDAAFEVPGLDHLPPLRVPELVLRQIAETLARV